MALRLNKFSPRRSQPSSICKLCQEEKRVLKINSLRDACTRIMRGSTINNNNKSSVSRSSQAIAISMQIPRNYKPEKWIIRKLSSYGTLQITKVLAKWSYLQLATIHAQVSINNQ
uniref:Uncharacterized protein n=1 Tax=Trichogramma kaykai TaxID=54128 RepID=A0ABD2W404_9HYME